MAMINQFKLPDSNDVYDLQDARIEAIDTTITDSENPPTSAAVKTFVEGLLTGKCDYLGTATQTADLSTTAGKGDFYRAANDFGLVIGMDVQNGSAKPITVSVHAGDLLIAEKDNPEAKDYSVIHGELDTIVDTFQSHSTSDAESANAVRVLATAIFGKEVKTASRTADTDLDGNALIAGDIVYKNGEIKEYLGNGNYGNIGLYGDGSKFVTKKDGAMQKLEINAGQGASDTLYANGNSIKTSSLGGLSLQKGAMVIGDQNNTTTVNSQFIAETTSGNISATISESAVGVPRASISAKDTSGDYAYSVYAGMGGAMMTAGTATEEKSKITLTKSDVNIKTPSGTSEDFKINGSSINDLFNFSVAGGVLTLGFGTKPAEDTSTS